MQNNTKRELLKLLNDIPEHLATFIPEDNEMAHSALALVCHRLEAILEADVAESAAQQSTEVAS